MFTNLYNSISTLKDQYFPNNQVEKDLFDIIHNSHPFANPLEYKQIVTYLNYSKNLLIIKKYIPNYLNLSVQYNQLRNLLNLIEYLIFNGNYDFVVTCKIIYKNKFEELANSYIYLENGTDKGLIIRKKMTGILWILNNEDYLFAERDKILNLNSKLDKDIKSYCKCCKCIICECENKINKCENKTIGQINITYKNDKKFNINIRPVEINLDSQKDIEQIKIIKKIVPISKNNNDSNQSKQIEQIDLIGLNDFY